MSAVTCLLAAVRTLHERTPALMNYAPWPEDLADFRGQPKMCAAVQTLTSKALRGTRATAQVIKSLRRSAHKLEWRQSYSEAEVGQRFLDNYGYVELFGPTGHFRSSQLRGYLGYWGPDLTYDWHSHEAEELYFSLAGQAVFSAAGASNTVVKPGQHRVHQSNQPHLMITLDQPFLAYALWRSSGMDGLPRLVPH